MTREALIIRIGFEDIFEYSQSRELHGTVFGYYSYYCSGIWGAEASQSTDVALHS